MLQIWSSPKFCMSDKGVICIRFHGFLFRSIITQVFLFNPFPNKPWFLRVCSTSLLKTQ